MEFIQNTPKPIVSQRGDATTSPRSRTASSGLQPHARISQNRMQSCGGDMSWRASLVDLAPERSVRDCDLRKNWVQRLQRRQTLLKQRQLLPVNSPVGLETNNKDKRLTPCRFASLRDSVGAQIFPSRPSRPHSSRRSALIGWFRP